MIRAFSLPRRTARVLMLAALTLPLGACEAIVLNPAGDVAKQQANLVVVSTLLMLLIIIPVMLLTVFFAWKYRASNQEARYEPDWDHSTQLELVIWAAPLLIIICLGALTWVTTHLLDPYRPITRLEKNVPVAAQVAPLEVNVVALDWKWLFIYPEQGIATVNELVVPKDRPVNFRITSQSVMNSFYVPALAGQVYAMPGMETKLHAVLNREGEFTGFSANYSGHGFSGMRFPFRGVSEASFSEWVNKVKSGKDTLDRDVYQVLSKPSENEATRHFASIDDALFNAVVDMCVQPGKMCMSQMMAIDAQGGLGLAGVYNVAMLHHDKYGRNDSFRPDAHDRSVDAAYVRALCADLDPGQVLPSSVYAPTDLSPLVGAGLRRPLDKDARVISQSTSPSLSPAS